jgi:hypothetical protein
VNRLNTEHIFLNHLLQPINDGSVMRNAHALIWPSIILLSVLVLIVLVKLYSYSRVILIIQSIFNTQVLQQLEREETSLFKFYNIALNITFVFNLSMLCFQINSVYNLILPQTDSFTQFLFFVVTISVAISFKTIINKVFVLLTGDKKVLNDYDTNASLINQAIGLFLFPWVILIQFGKFNPVFLLSSALVILATGFFIKWYRGVIMSLVEQRVGLLQILSYFCGLEILPICVMVKYTIETF